MYAVVKIDADIRLAASNWLMGENTQVLMPPANMNARALTDRSPPGPGYQVLVCDVIHTGIMTVADGYQWIIDNQKRGRQSKRVKKDTMDPDFAYNVEKLVHDMDVPLKSLVTSKQQRLSSTPQKDAPFGLVDVYLIQ